MTALLALLIMSLPASAEGHSGPWGPMVIITVHGYDGPIETVCRMTWIRYAYPASAVDCVVIDQDGIFRSGFGGSIIIPKPPPGPYGRPDR